MVQAFASDIETRVFNLVYLLWLLSELVGAGIIPSVRRHLRRHGTLAEREKRILIKREKYSSYAFMIGSILVAGYFASKLASSGIAMLPSWVSYPGIVLMVSGILLRQWSIAVLGRFFSPIIATQEGQKVVNNGPYRLVRHPSYTGLFLILAGLGLVMQSWGAILLLVVISGLTLGYRMYVEEKALISELGDEYIKYSKRTKRLIPYVL